MGKSTSAQTGVPALLLASLLSSGSASASPPAESVRCTDPATRPQWLSEQAIRQQFGDQDYATAKLKVSRGGCYEFYAVRRDGSIVEAYYHPISGKLVRFNEVLNQYKPPSGEPGTTNRP